MSYKGAISFLLLFLFALKIQVVKSQSLNINGDTIFVNNEAEIQLVFPTYPMEFSTVPVDNNFVVWKSPTGINLIAASEEEDTAMLIVSEAERKHRFVLVFKNHISNRDVKLYYDYSTIKKLEDHLKKTGIAKSSVPVQPSANNDNAQPNNKNKGSTASNAGDNSSYYFNLLKQGDKDLKRQNYEDAKSSFDKAGALRPDEIVPKQKLEEIKNKMAEKEKAQEQLNNKKYLVLNTEAKKKMDQKKYAEARLAYTRVLELRPGDVYATQQLQVINDLTTKRSVQTDKPVDTAKLKNNIVINNNPDTQKIVKAELPKTSKQIADEKYNASIKSGDSLFKAGNYESAKTYYNTALGLYKTDWPRSQIYQINKILTARAEEEKKKTEQVAKNQANKDAINTKLEETNKQLADEKFYNATIAVADSLFKKGDYENAKAQYNKAVSFSKKDWPRQQINKIDKILNDQLTKINNNKAPEASNTALKEEVKVDSVPSPAEIKRKYNLAMTNGRSYFLISDFDSAKIFYEEAAALQPLQKDPKNQLKIINTKLEALAKENEINSNYYRAIEIADSFVIVKNYDSAIAGYKRALSIKPLEYYPGKQIKYIQSTLVLNEKKRIQDRELQFKNAISKADQAVKDKEFENAGSAYTEALSIHPENEYAKRRLAIISYQIQLEQARREQLRQDSLKLIVPVKKTKKRR